MIKERIKRDLISALKKKEGIKISTLRLLLNAIFIKEKEKRYKISKENSGLVPEEVEKRAQLSDEEITKIIFSEIKKRKETIEAIKKSGREDLLKKEKEEMEILKKYLPKLLTEEEIKKLAQEIIRKLKVEGKKDKGKVMRELMPKIKGRAEGKKVAEIVEELLLE